MICESCYSSLFVAHANKRADLGTSKHNILLYFSLKLLLFCFLDFSRSLSHTHTVTGQGPIVLYVRVFPLSLASLPQYVVCVFSS